jgi:murein DD-endopeptidase MepM/ murein hydrolase activator NlpD
MRRSGLSRGVAVGTVLLLTACADVRILSEFGSQTTCERGYRSSPHSGVDIYAAYGDAVIASADGFVGLAGDFPWRPPTGAWCGTAIILRHDFDAQTLYCHLSQTAVAEGARVKRGDIIGYVGTTGYTNPRGALPECMHVHLELSQSGAKVDPLPLFAGCFDPKRMYSDDRLTLTYPIKCVSR